MNMYKFVKFEGRNARMEDRITVTKSKSIGFPTKFYKDNNIQNFKYVVLFYDQEKKAIAIKFTNDIVEKNKFAIIKSTQGYGGSVVAQSFFKSLGIDAEKYANRYNWEKTNIEGIGEIYVINLIEKLKSANDS